MKNGLIALVTFLLLIGAGVMLYKGNTQKVENPQKENKISEAITPEETKEMASVVNEIELSIMQPQNNTTVTTSTVTIVGKATPNADIFVNDKELKADAQGNFSTTIELDEGENTISIVANNEEGIYAEKELVVTLDSGQ